VIFTSGGSRLPELGVKGGQRFLEGARGLGDGSPPAGFMGKVLRSGVWGRSPPEAEAFCLNIDIILSVHGRKFKELDFTHSDSIKLVINKASIQLFAVIPLNAFTSDETWLICP